MAHGLVEQQFYSHEDAKKWVDSWAVSKNVLFFQYSIEMLPERWKNVMASNGQYFQRHVFTDF